MKAPPINDAVEQARHAAEQAAHSAQQWAGNAQEWAGSIGQSLRRTDAAKWLEAGLKIGALRTGAKVVGGFARRNPVVAVATVAGVGLVWYAARRQARQRQAIESGGAEAIEGKSRRIEARKGKGRQASARKQRAEAVTPSAE